MCFRKLHQEVKLVSIPATSNVKKCDNIYRLITKPLPFLSSFLLSDATQFHPNSKKSSINRPNFRRSSFSLAFSVYYRRQQTQKKKKSHKRKKYGKINFRFYNDFVGAIDRPVLVAIRSREYSNRRLRADALGTLR
jgi:hypothetical protein